MKKKIAMAITACFLFAFATPCLAAQALVTAGEQPLSKTGQISERTAGAAVLMDLATTRVLASKNAHARLPMASTTKVMTALLAVENCPLNHMVTVPAEAYGQEGSSMYLQMDEKISMGDLLYGLMLVSGNDAAVAIAITVGGSVEGFAGMMNNRAAALGCTNTNFVTPNGLPDERHYTSAYDLALITAAAMKNPIFREIVNTQYRKCESGEIVHTLKNKNKLLWNYKGGNGVKTGFTKAAGKCLTFSAERNGNGLIGVVLNCPDMWNTSIELLDFGFDNHNWHSYAAAGEVIQEVTVLHGMKNSLEILAKEDILIPLRKGEQENAVELRVNCARSVEAPVYAGQEVGTLEAWADGRLLYSVPLVSGETVSRKEYSYYIGRLIKDFIA